ncbi:cyclopropane fatty acyl phospholipid synthase [bacterium]|nr:cyclopropane fatty acyl phospholipid synthase [bacterium]
MAINNFKENVVGILGKAGISVGGKNSWDLKIKNEKFYERILMEGSLGAGESYMDGWWDSDKLDQFFERIFRYGIEKYARENWRIIWHHVKSRLFNMQSRSRVYKVGEEHYDVGNDLYKAMLDRRMLYTCGYWKNAKTLDEAQEAKLELVCQKIGLEPGMTVLEFGCGFASFAKYAAEKYGAKVTGLTVSKEQVKLGQELCKGLPVDIRLEDYRNIKGKFDRVISIGVLEHVGYKNYHTYMKQVDRTLKDDGIAFIHTIGGNQSKTATNAWSDKYIFPNGMIPSIAQIGKAMEGLFIMEDWHNFGEDYDKTLMAWYENFEKAWPRLKKNYSNRFYRMWRFYLLSSAAGFRCRDLQLWQIVMTKAKTRRTQPICRIS